MSEPLERIAEALERIADAMEGERDANAATRMLATALMPQSADDAEPLPQWKRDRMAASGETRR